MVFDKDWAKPENIVPGQFRFLDTRNVRENEAQSLLIQAFDYTIPAEEVKKKDYNRDFEALTSAIPEDFFPPCIKLIMAGTDDGRKRSMFILMNFLASVGYNHDKIDEMLHEWNKKNREQLREVLLKGHLRYKRIHNDKVLPPNCDNAAYYKSFGVCKPDNFCPRIKNPANYAILKAKLAQPKEKKRQVLTEEQKEMRRKYLERMKAENRE
jgi:DNA primase large subunit